MYHRIYVGSRYATELCDGCLEKFTRDHVVVIVIPPPGAVQVDPDLYHRTCFEDRFGVEVESLGHLVVSRPQHSRTKEEGVSYPAPGRSDSV
jgi:hypothetical protein